MGPYRTFHTEILRPVCRYARTARVADQVVREIDEAIARAFGDAGEPGPSYLEIPTDVLRTSVPSNLILQDWIRPKPRRQLLPHPDAVDHAVELIQQSKRPLVVTGRGARNSKSFAYGPHGRHEWPVLGYPGRVEGCWTAITQLLWVPRAQTQCRERIS